MHNSFTAAPPVRPAMQQQSLPPIGPNPLYPPQFPSMFMYPLQQQTMLPRMPVRAPMFPAYSFMPMHNLPMQPLPTFQPFPQLPLLQSPQCMPQLCPMVTPTTSRKQLRPHNTSLNGSLLGSASLNDSVRFNPMGGRGPIRLHNTSLSVDNTNTSSERSFQTLDLTEIANNFELINYCILELSKKEYTEEDLAKKVCRSRRFKHFGAHIPAAITLILNTFPYFTPRTYAVKTDSFGVNNWKKVTWVSDKRHVKKRGNRLNATMFEIPDRSVEGGEILSILGDVASIALNENNPPTTVSSVEQEMKKVNL